MRQRVMFALGIAGEPRLLVADEPTTALDVTVQRRLLELLTELCASTGMALILVTHDLGVVSDVCDSVLVMYAGQSMESGSTETIFGRSRHPYTAALMQARPSMTDDLGARLKGLPGRPPAVGAWPSGCRFADRCPLAVDQCRSSPRRSTRSKQGISSGVYVLKRNSMSELLVEVSGVTAGYDARELTLKGVSSLSKLVNPSVLSVRVAAGKPLWQR